MDGACFMNGWDTKEENHKRRNGRKETTEETTPKTDGQCTGYHDETYTITKISWTI